MTNKKMMELISEELVNRGYEAKAVEVAKNNRMVTGICVVNGNVGTTFYADIFENTDLPIACLADEVEERYKDLAGTEPDTSKMMDPGFILEHLEIRLCKEDWNRNRLDGAVSKRVYETDLIQYLVVVIDLPSGGKGSCILRQDLMDSLGLSENDVWMKALSRLQYKVTNMGDIFGFLPESNPLMVVISNNDAFNGASAVVKTEALQEAARMLGSERIFIIPSSIHECIAVPADSVKTDILRSMICDVNHDVVDLSEHLSDHPYLWDGNSLISAA